MKDEMEIETMSNEWKRVSPKTRKRARELRRELTPIEAILWQRLRSRRLAGLKFRRQHPIGPFITDFYCAERKLVIEIDGDTHAEQARYDASRTAWLEEQGNRVIRFNNRDVLDNLPGVLEMIKDES